MAADVACPLDVAVGRVELDAAGVSLGRTIKIQETDLDITAFLAGIKAAIGSLDRVTQFLYMGGYVNATPGFDKSPQVINGAPGLKTMADLPAPAAIMGDVRQLIENRKYGV